MPVLPVLLALNAGDDGAEVRRGQEEREFAGAEVSARPGLRAPLTDLGGHMLESDPFLARGCGDFDLKLLPFDLGDTGDRGEATRGEPGAFVGLARFVLHGLPLLTLGADVVGTEPARELLGFGLRPGLWEGGLADVRAG